MGAGQQPGGGGNRRKRTGAIAGIGAIIMAVVAALQIMNEGGDVDALLTALTPGETAAPNGGVIAQRQTTQDSAIQKNAPFDYYVLSLSWSPSFCAGRPDADQCGRGHRFIVHGLWPQFERGFPSDCDTGHGRPGSRLLNRYAEETTESPGLLAHQWRKHGTCTGLDPEGYFEATLRAAKAVRIPSSFETASRDLDVDPRVIEKAFIDANPDLDRDAVTIKCRDNQLTEVRVCLTTGFEPRKCGKDVIRDCRARVIDVPAPK